MKREIHIITGVTAVGKTSYALEYADAHNAEIISCDASLVYRGMDIGTAKPSQQELAQVPHHLIDLLEVQESCDIVKYNHFWQGSIYFKDDTNFVEKAHDISFIYKAFPVVLVLSFSFFVVLYFKAIKNYINLSNKFLNKLMNFIKKKWYFDEFYNYLFIKKIEQLSKFLWMIIDKKAIDGLGPIGFSSTIFTASKYLKKVQMDAF